MNKAPKTKRRSRQPERGQRQSSARPRSFPVLRRGAIYNTSNPRGSTVKLIGGFVFEGWVTVERVSDGFQYDVPATDLTDAEPERNVPDQRPGANS